MILAIQKLYSDAVTEEAAARFDTTREQLKDLGGFESYVYEFEKDGQAYILKITHTIRRSEDYIHGELEWLNYLADNGVAVARAVPSRNGRMIERIEQPDGSAFLAMCYEKAPGQYATKEQWNGELFEAWGRLMGRMHALTKDYVLSNPAYKRQEWHQEEQLNVAKYVPADQTQVIERAESLMKRLHALPQDRDSYGLLHADLHPRNFHVDAAGGITAFDFDDIGYNWFINDIAISLFYARWRPWKSPEEQSEFVQVFLEHYMRGYLQENELDLSWFEHVHDFLKLRNILLYTSYFQVDDASQFTAEERAEQETFKTFIEQDKQLVDFDFAAFANTLR